jgi:hypothetical protein
MTMKKLLFTHFFLLLMIVPLLARQHSTFVAADSTGLNVHDDRADTLTVSIDSMEVEDIHPQDSPEDRGFLLKND